MQDTNKSDAIARLENRVRSLSQSFDYVPILPFINKYPIAWDTMRKELGQATSYDLAKLPRDEVLLALRLEHKWMLEKIGSLFNLTRERVRQITEISMHGEALHPIPNQEAIKQALTIACQSPDAWTTRGTLSRKWLEKQLDSVSSSSLMIYKNPEMSKLRILLKYGLDCATQEQQIGQFREWQFGRLYYSYSDIAKYLTNRFVPITTMSVHRGAMALGYKGHSRGAPGQARNKFISDADTFRRNR